VVVGIEKMLKSQTVLLVAVMLVWIAATTMATDGDEPADGGWDSRIRVAKRFASSGDSRIRLAKKFPDGRIRLAKKDGMDNRIRLAKKTSVVNRSGPVPYFDSSSDLASYADRKSKVDGYSPEDELTVMARRDSSNQDEGLVDRIIQMILNRYDRQNLMDKRGFIRLV